MSDCAGYYTGNWPFTVTGVRQVGDNCYFGLPNQAAAQWAIDNGYNVGHDPRFPDGAGLFIILPTQPLATPIPPPVGPPPTPICPDGMVWDEAAQACIEVAGTSTGGGGSGGGGGTAPPTGPIYGTEPTGDPWSKTKEGSDVVDAWAYYVDTMNNKLPAVVQDLQNLKARPITG